MTIRDKTSMAWSNLGRRKVRTVLTSVGVIVGIMTVVTLVSLVNGVQLQVKQQFEKIGLDRVEVRPPGETPFGNFGGGGGFDIFGTSERTHLITPADVKRWKSWPDVQEVIPEIDMPPSVQTGLRLNGKMIQVRVSNESAPRRGIFASAPDAVAGTLDLPDARGGLVVSQGALKALHVPDDKMAGLVGQNADVLLVAPRGEKQSYTLKIAGVSSERSRSVSVSTPDRIAMKGWWFNDNNLLKKNGYDSVTLRTADVSAAKEVAARLRKEPFTVQSIDAILNVADRIFSVITAMLALVSSVALLVACIGIANTMIMSIYERTREIGTLKAMGASRGDIRQMFMMEAGLIGLFGGAAGLLFSWLLGRGLNGIAHFIAQRRELPLPQELFIITPSLVVESLVFAFLIGIVAGLYPANRAARLDPLVALRHD